MKIINEDLILLDVDLEDKDVLFECIASLFKQNSYVDDAEEFKDAMFFRETEAPTGIGNLCAIPHGISDTVKEPGVCFIRLKDCIDYPEIALETGRVKYVFGLAIPKTNTSNHVKVLSTIACLLMEKSFQDLIATSPEKGEILNAIKAELHAKGL